MLSYFVGGGWAILFGLAALVALGLAGFYAIWGDSGGRLKVVLPSLVIGGLCLGMTFWAQTHFRVGVNERALLKDTIKQELIGTRNSGVQARPPIGVDVMKWPATLNESIQVPLETGMASAPAKLTNTPLKLSPTFYLNLSGLRLEEAYRDGYTSWGDLLNRYILVQAGNVARSVAQNFTVEEHSTKKDDWARQFDERLAAFFSQPGEGYGIVVIQGRTVLTWDFINPEDAKAYDTANRSNFLLVEKENQLAAARKDAEIAATRGKALLSTAQAGINSWEPVVEFVRNLSADERQAVYNYWQLQPDMEYLRLQSERIKEAGPMFPPRGGPALTFETR